MNPSSIVRACGALTCDGVEFRLGDTVWLQAISWPEGPRRVETAVRKHSIRRANGFARDYYLYDEQFGYPVCPIGKLFSTEAAAWAFYAGQLAKRKEKIDKRLTEIAGKIDELAASVR